MAAGDSGMKRLPLSEMKMGSELHANLYSEGGEEILKEGEKLDKVAIGLLNRLGIKHLFQPEDAASLKQFLFKAQYRQIPVDNLPDGITLQKPLKDLDGRVLLETGETLNKETKKKVIEKGVGHIYVPRSSEERMAGTAARFRTAIETLHKVRNLTFEKKDLVETKPENLTQENVDKQIEFVNLDAMPSGEALRKAISDIPRVAPRTAEEKEAVSGFSNQLLQKVFTVFKMFQDPDAMSKNGDTVESLSRNVIETFIRDRELLLNTVNIPHQTDYLIQHPIDVTVLAVNIAASMNFSPKQVMEIAYASFLLDVGMFKVPRTIREKPGQLTTAEFLEIQKHSIHNLNMLQKMRRLPATTPMVIYQIHEREDKSGYPRRRPGNLIHKYAKIISVADTYAALVARRPYRKAQSPYDAMRTVIDLGAARKLDPAIIRAFLQFVCLFPVGSWVKLNSGEIGKVIATNSKDYTKPVVKILYDDKGNPADRIVNLSDTPEIGITEGLNWDKEKYTAGMGGF